MKLLSVLKTAPIFLLATLATINLVGAAQDPVGGVPVDPPIATIKCGKKAEYNGNRIVTCTHCADTAADKFCNACMRDLCDKKVTDPVEAGNQCALCPDSTTKRCSEKPLVSTPWDANECWNLPDQSTDCDGDGDLDVLQTMRCSGTYSWTFECNDDC